MIRVCCGKDHQGPRVMGEIEPYDDISITSGFCETCFSKIEADLEEHSEVKNERIH